MTDKMHDPSPDAEPSEASLSLHDKHVAVPEVRTGKVDVEGDFHKDQHAEAHQGGISFDTVAVPEYHTGKCPEYDSECKEHDERKHHGVFSDLARMLANGTLDD